MSIASKYNPEEVESKWYSTWLEKKVFSSTIDKDKEPFTVVIPPPNVTGVLHMGHMLNNTIQDILVRKARMEGKAACWVPGTDHASIATESKVVKKLAEQGISKEDLTREEFLKHAWEWTDTYGGIILDQLKKLGASCDWDRQAFTLDKERSESVIKVFVDLYRKGYIYRGARMVNWDPEGKTALSDEEVIHEEVNSKLYHVKYKIVDSDEFITIATTRPETILGDSAICINPDDERYSHLEGKKVIVPLVNREIPIIFDTYVDMEFGTGCLKVTPAHDINDYELGLKYNLEVIDILTDEGKISEAGQFFVGEDRFVARKNVIKAIDELGQFVEAKDIVNSVGRSERTKAVVEPKISTQWFCKMSDMATPALENVLNDTIKIHPPKFKNMYRSWMENVRDWCISRQLWWGHQIPAWYLPSGEFVVAENTEEALVEAQKIDASITADQLKQDDDALDTWFSSWLWPMSVFDGVNNPDNEEYKYYYPTDTLVTGFDIIFFWVARMIMAGYEFAGELPFKNVYITGMVRDEQGHKMSKSLGNSPDPLDLIKEYTADGVRTGMLFSAPAGNDLLFNEKLCLQGRNFGNKIWNSAKLVTGWEVSEEGSDVNAVAIQWINARINQVLAEVEDHYSKYRISDALMAIYKLVFDDFCGWYLEMIKPEYLKPIDKTTYEATIDVLEKVLKILHPFMPFITEELWSSIRERAEGDLITIAEYPKVEEYDQELLKETEHIQNVISAVRNIRNAKQIAKKDAIELFVKTANQEPFKKYETIIGKYSMANLSKLEFVSEPVEGAIKDVVVTDEIFVPLAGNVNVEEEKAKLQKDLDYQKGFLTSVSKKLSNERFVNNAPEQVVNAEKKKMADAEAKIKTLEESLAALG
ncbi:MAG: valine--tRNA ligase [Cytophagales bacterium]|nr:valine--tRNA ligase [Cytophagales bacterium]